MASSASARDCVPETGSRAFPVFIHPGVDSPFFPSIVLSKKTGVFPGFPEVFWKEGSLERMGKVPLEFQADGGGPEKAQKGDVPYACLRGPVTVRLQI